MRESTTQVPWKLATKDRITEKFEAPVVQLHKK